MSTERVSPQDRKNQGIEANLEFKNGQRKETLPLGNFFTVGRDDINSLQLEDSCVSSRHFRIEKKEQGFLLRDQQSSNGTFVNSTKVKEVWLQNGDRIRAGRSELVFRWDDKDSMESFLQSKNRSWQREVERMPQIALSDLPVLIMGESGTGKELLAQHLHEQSRRKDGPFVSVNCSALSESLVESELFGHCKGSFTGAVSERKGAFQSALGGTLFLDEVGDLPSALQPKLLRALENSEVRPVGSDTNVHTDVRVVAATHQNIQSQVRRGQFRQDLYFRLNVVRLSPPPLRERMEDFETLLYRFAKEYRVGFSFHAIMAMKDYSWPGNIRELKNSIARASALFTSQRVETEDVVQLLEPFPVQKDPLLEETPSRQGSRDYIRALEKEMIVERLLAHRGNQRKAALDLGIPKSTLHDRIRSYKIDVRRLKGE